jgi:hypothetical protein
LEGLVEHHLVPLLKNFDNFVYLDYMRRISCSFDGDRESFLSPVESWDHAGNIAFRIKFRLPVFLMLSHPICRFRSQRSYPLREGFFFASLGLVPVFFSTLNRMAVLKLWGNRVAQFFNPSNEPLPEAQTVCWKLPVSSRPVEFSSMNIVEQNGSEPDEVDEYLSGIFEKHFRLLYWVLPSRGFSGSSHFLYGRKNITSFIKISKSLYQVEEIQNPQTVVIEGREIQTRQVTVKALGEKNGSYFFNRFSALMDNELANEIMGSNTLETAFINGTVSEIRQTGGRRYSLLTVKADYALSRYDVIQCLIGMVAAKKFQDTDTLADVGTVNEIREEVGNILYSVEREMKIPFTLADLMENLLETCLSHMFPVLLRDNNNRIKLIHPAVWGFLTHWKLLEKEDKGKQASILFNMLKILESRKSHMGLYLSEECEAFHKLGIDKNEILRSLSSLKKLIGTSKEIDSIFEGDTGL